MEKILNISNVRYNMILNRIIKKADLENMEVWFMDIYNYLEAINKKQLMPFILKDLENVGLKVVLNKVSADYKDLQFTR